MLVFFVLVFPLFAASTAVFEYNETDFISLRPEAADPDSDSLTYFFNRPLSNKGEWQTDYGDRGIYNTKVTVSDGRLTSTQNITLIVHKKEEPPSIEIITPKKSSIYLVEGESILFDIQASDLNKDALNISWILDDQVVSEASYYIYNPGFYSQGEHKLLVVVTDGINKVMESWDIEVANFDRSLLLEDLKSITINETETITLRLPDLKMYGLDYNISAPIGKDAIWKTNYDDSGLYTVTITIWDKVNFTSTKSIKILVENVDRPASFLKDDSYWLYEDEKIEILLNYTDPDGDLVDVQAFDLPEGMTFRYNFF
jgi:hypothetical protein